MNHSQASITALISAFGRAYHAKHDNSLIFDDSLAEKLFAPEELAGIGQMLAGALGVFDPEAAAAGADPQTALSIVMRAQSTPITLSRARYTEELLEAAIREGIQQYVILGAGFDTFAFRRPELLGSLRIYELDHPATQAEKLRRISMAGWAKPEQLHFVPIDFAQESLQPALRRTAFDARIPTFFSWLGVTYYLAEETVVETLRSISSLAQRGSTVVFDYVDADAFEVERTSARMQKMQMVVRRTGEPMRTGFDPGRLAGVLEDAGLALVEQLSPAQIQARYFEGREDGYAAFDHVHFCQASVSGG